MWNLIKRIFNIGKANAHKALDAIEDPVLQLEQTVRDLKIQHGKSVEGVAKAKTYQLKLDAEVKKFKDQAKSYKSKATRLKTKYENADESDKNELKEGIILMLNKYENMNNEAKAKTTAANKQKQFVTKLTNKVKDLESMIKETENSITNIKAEQETAAVNKEVSKQLSSSNMDGVNAQIERLKERAQQDNLEAEAWDQLDDDMMDDEERVNQLLEEDSPTENSELFDNFMSK